MTEAWQSAADRFGAKATARDELDSLTPAEIRRLRIELDTSRRELDQVIDDLILEAFASPYGQPDAPKDLDVSVQKRAPSPHSNHIRIADEQAAKFVNERLVGTLRELVNVMRDARSECAAQRAGVDWRKLPRYHRRRSHG